MHGALCVVPHAPCLMPQALRVVRLQVPTDSVGMRVVLYAACPMPYAIYQHINTSAH